MQLTQQTPHSYHDTDVYCVEKKGLCWVRKWKQRKNQHAVYFRLLINYSESTGTNVNTVLVA